MRRAIALAHRLGDAVANIALQADRFPVVAQVLAVVAAETAGKILVLVLVGKILPGHAWLIEDEPVDEFLRHALCFFDLLRIGSSGFWMRLLILIPQVRNSLQGLLLAVELGLEQIEHVLLGIR